DPGAHLRLALAAQRAVGRQTLVAQLRDAPGRRTGQHVGHVGGAEAAAQLRRRLQDLRRGAGGVGALHRLAEAAAAGAAALALVALAEVRHQRAVTADGLLAERVHLAELAQRPRRRLRPVGRQHRLPEPVVATAVQQQALGLQAVAAGAAGLLLVV